MNDQLDVKKLLFNQITSTQLDTTTRSFPRVAGSKTEARRRSLHVNALSPCDLIISHIPRTAKNPTQRSLVAVDQTLTRFDASSNPISKTGFRVALQFNIPSDVTLAEFREAYALLFGLVEASNGALLDELYMAAQ